MTSATAVRGEPAVDWLLASHEPAIRFMVRRDLLGEEAADERGRVLDGAIVRGLLAGQQPDGGFGIHPYGKWHGAHWRLVSLVELEIPRAEPHALAALDTVLAWLLSPGHRSNVPVIEGLARRCASQEGNAVAVACRLGMADDPRVEVLARSLIEWQWPDGGWNCDRRPEARRSSFHESLPAMWALHEYASATGDKPARRAAAACAELFLEHRVFRSLKTGEPMHPSMLDLHYPPYWHYDVLQAMLILWRMGLASDPRTDDAAEHLARRRKADGHWHAVKPWWKAPGGPRAAEAVDWGEHADQMVTLNVLRVLGGRGDRVAALPAS